MNSHLLSALYLAVDATFYPIYPTPAQAAAIKPSL